MRRVLLFVILLLLLTPWSTTSASDRNGVSGGYVDPVQIYSYNQFVEDVDKLVKAYPDLLEIEILGQTEYGRDLIAIKFGKGTEYNVLFNGAHHAREHMTTNLLMEMIDAYAEAYVTGKRFKGYDVREELQRGTIWFVPMVNPDGVALQQEGLKAFPEEVHAELIKMNDGSKDFTRWKANAQGVDPNRQYPAEWDKIQNNTGKPFWWNYKGEKPLEIIEVKVLYDLIERVDPEMVFSYHSSGEIIYWWFHGREEVFDRDKRLVEEVSKQTGYRPVTPSKNASGGGLTDWFVSNKGKPAYTMEIGRWVNNRHLDVSEFHRVWEQNSPLGLWALNRGYRLWLEKQEFDEETKDLSEFMVTERLRLYSAPDFTARTSATIRQQVITPVDRKGNWYQIESYVGLQWVYVSEGLKASFVEAEESLPIFKQLDLYVLPFRKDTKISSVSPQTLKVVGYYEGYPWYKVKTWLGDMWVYYPCQE